jgi:DNA-binding MarR family transcriptional regulator
MSVCSVIIPSELSVHDAHISRRMASQGKYVHHARMSAAIHRALFTLAGLMNRPEPDAELTSAAGISLEAGLLPLLVRVGLQGPIGVVQAAELLGRDHSTVSRQVARLEAQGLVARTPSPQDGRLKLAEVTPAGRKALDAIDAARRQLMEAALASWSAADRRNLERLLTKLADQAEAWRRDRET